MRNETKETGGSPKLYRLLSNTFERVASHLGPRKPSERADGDDPRRLVESEYRYWVRFAYLQCLGREPDRGGLRAYIALLKDGLPFSQLVEELKSSAEGTKWQQHTRSETEYLYWIRFAYENCLGRAPDEGGMQAYLARLKDGLPFSLLIEDLKNSPEGIRHQQGNELWEEFSDGDFLLAIAELLRLGATPKDLDLWRQAIVGDPDRRLDLVGRLLRQEIARLAEKGKGQDPQECWIAGTGRKLTPAMWKQKADELAATKSLRPAPVPKEARAPFQHSGRYVVSAIASLYKGRKYIEKFLENITSQSIFDQSELIIIDADSPEGEGEIIAEYQKIYPNIVYRRMDYRIRIYDAWNVGISMARGRYLTNTNMDDLRRKDSFELQSFALDRNPFADVTYQEFFYSLDGSLDFDAVADFGFKSALPIVTPNSLLAYNSPHNAPMWRKSLHDEMGLFDTSFESAGDYEFWLRCLCKGKQFIKVNEPHVVYYQNPMGISTKVDSKGLEEGRRILSRYCRQLVSPHLLMSREAFAETLGIASDWSDKKSYYQIVHDQLRALAGRSKALRQNAEAREEKLSTVGACSDEAAC
ncbi:MAG: glycosyltransferase [Methylovirgula sp.]